MKKILIMISVIASVAIVLSCKTQVEPTAQFAASKGDFSVASSSTSISASQSDSATTVLTLTWADPKYATKLPNSSFTVYVAPTNTNFAKFATRSYTGVLSAALRGDDLNGMALQVGGVVGQTITLDIKVVASQGNNNEQKTSNIIQLTYAPYGDLPLWASSASVTASAATSAKPADTLSWGVAFKGFNGVKSYWIQYAQGGTNFASPISTAATALNHVYTQLDLNKIALAVGVTPGGSGNVDFRIKAANELKDTIYSNVVTINVSTYVAYNSIGVIGDGIAPYDWSNDVDMYRPDPINSPSNWTLTVYLKAGNVKFRADDGWTTNWGGTSFPSGTGTQNGNNIAVPTAGWYQINFNAGTGAYSFTSISTTTYTNISLIGDFNSWGADDDLTADASGHIWTGTVTVAAAGGIKFRANHDWTTAWGSSTFPSGYSSTSGGNISIAAGSYFVYFNDVSGEFFFGNTNNNAGAGTSYSQIGIIGDGTPGGWNTDSFLIQDPANPYKWSGKVTLTAGGAKFRADAAWTTSWGGTTFPTGQGTTQNDPNINVTAGTPQITFNSATGEYSFTY